MKHTELHRLLDALEAQLQRRGWWETESPPAEALASVEPFAVDRLTFSQWLQWIYLPRMRTLTVLPQASGLHPIAEEAWKGCADSAELLSLVWQLDVWVNGQHED